MCGACDMADERENPMVAWIAEYEAALADKPYLASIYDDEWRQRVRPKLLGRGDVCYLRNAFGYQAPLFEGDLIPKGWQAKLEEGASVLFPVLTDAERRHLMRRMRDTESTSAEEEILLAGGFAREFGPKAIAVSQASRGEPRPEFEVNANDYRILVEAKGRLEAGAIEEERKQRQTIEDATGIKIQEPLLPDEKADDWIKKTTFNTLRTKSQAGDGFVLVLSLYTMPDDLFVLIDTVRTLAMSPGNPACFRREPSDLCLAEEYWALAIALVFHGLIQGVWFNRDVSRRLGIDTTTQERIRTAINSS